MPRSSLTIVATRPFKSSNLAIPPSPFSPRYPVTPPPRAAALEIKTGVGTALDTRTVVAIGISPPPPPEPLRWLWQCHLCSRVYRLSVTRRCLDDGHHFCSGTTTVKRSRRNGRRVLRHRACASEFDYQGWRAWGEWRRGIAAARVLDAAEESLQCAHLAEDVWADRRPLPLPSTFPGCKDCWATCDYPSECRWGKHARASATSHPSTRAQSSDPATMVPSPPPLNPPPPPPPPPPPKTSFEDILLDLSAGQSEVPRAQHVEVAAPCSLTPSDPPTDFDAKQPSVDDLMASAQRRKRRSLGPAPSPLGSHPPSPGGDGSGAEQSGDSTAEATVPPSAPPVASAGGQSTTTVAAVTEPPPAYIARNAMEGLEMEDRRGRRSLGGSWALDDADLELARFRGKERRASELALGFWACVRDASSSSSSLSSSSGSDSLLAKSEKAGRGRNKGKSVGERGLF